MYLCMVSIKTHLSSIRDVVLSMCPLVTSEEILLYRNKYYKIGKNRESLDQSKRKRNKDILESTRAYMQDLSPLPQSCLRIFWYTLFARWNTIKGRKKQGSVIPRTPESYSLFNTIRQISGNIYYFFTKLYRSKS